MTLRDHKPKRAPELPGDDERRQDEALAAFARVPPACRMADALRMIQCPRDTWYRWRAQPRFAAKLKDILRRRAEVNLEPLYDQLGAIVDAVAHKAKRGDMQAAAIALKAVGVTIDRVEVVPPEKPAEPESADAIQARLRKLEEALRAGDPTEGET